MEVLPDFAEATNAKLETRYIINYYSIGAINCFTAEPTPKLYVRGHNLLDFTEATFEGLNVWKDLERELRSVRSILSN